MKLDSSIRLDPSKSTTKQRTYMHLKIEKQKRNDDPYFNEVTKRNSRSSSNRLESSFKVIFSSRWTFNEQVIRIWQLQLAAKAQKNQKKSYVTKGLIPSKKKKTFILS